MLRSPLEVRAGKLPRQASVGVDSGAIGDEKEHVWNSDDRLALCGMHGFGINHGFCAIQSTLGWVVRINSTGVLWSSREAKLEAKLHIGLVCGCDPLSDDLQLVNDCYRRGVGASVSVHGDLSGALVCPVGSFCRWRPGTYDERRKYPACGSRSLGLGLNGVAPGDRF